MTKGSEREENAETIRILVKLMAIYPEYGRDAELTLAAYQDELREIPTLYLGLAAARCARDARIRDLPRPAQLRTAACLELRKRYRRARAGAADYEAAAELWSVDQKLADERRWLDLMQAAPKQEHLRRLLLHQRERAEQRRLPATSASSGPFAARAGNARADLAIPDDGDQENHR